MRIALTSSIVAQHPQLEGIFQSGDKKVNVSNTTGHTDSYCSSHHVWKHLEKVKSTDNHAILPLWKRVKQKLRLRSRLHHWFYQGSHPSIYPEYIDDFKKVKDAVLSAGLTEKELNVSRKDIAKIGDHITI